MARKSSTKENLELADEHIKIAEDIIVKESNNADDVRRKKYTDAELDLEKAESIVEELNE
jgi:hypothetical protein